MNEQVKELKAMQRVLILMIALMFIAVVRINHDNKAKAFEKDTLITYLEMQGNQTAFDNQGWSDAQLEIIRQYEKQFDINVDTEPKGETI